MKTLIGVQQDYIDTVNSAVDRWAHRPKPAYQLAGGHAHRTIWRAHQTLEAELVKLGVTDKAQIRQIIKDAADVAEMERLAND